MALITVQLYNTQGNKVLCNYCMFNHLSRFLIFFHFMVKARSLQFQMLFISKYRKGTVKCRSEA